jgi:predicted AlkP superfamily phosphohydrolase/phosphomutase
MIKRRYYTANHTAPLKFNSSRWLNAQSYLRINEQQQELHQRIPKTEEESKTKETGTESRCQQRTCTTP